MVKFSRSSSNQKKNTITPLLKNFIEVHSLLQYYLFDILSKYWMIACPAIIYENINTIYLKPVLSW